MEETKSSLLKLYSNWPSYFEKLSSMGTVENDVLTKNDDDLTMENVEAQNQNSLAAQKKTDYFPFFTLGISLVQIFFFYIAGTNQVLIFGLDPYRRHEIWRLITMCLVHERYMYLWSAVGFQVVIGVSLEIVHGWKRVAIIYLASVLGGSLFVSVVNRFSYSHGASGAVYGLIFSHLATLILNWNEVDRKFVRLFCILFYVSQDFIVGIYYELLVPVEMDTSHMRHLGGGITGFLVSILLFDAFQKHSWADKSRKICIAILTLEFVVIFFINTTASNYPPTQWNFDYKRTYYDHTMKSFFENMMSS